MNSTVSTIKPLRLIALFACVGSAAFFFPPFQPNPGTASPSVQQAVVRLQASQTGS